MAKLSRATKDTIQTIAVIVLVVLAILVFVVYPLNRTKALMARPDLETFDSKQLSMNDPTAFVSAGLKVDTFRVEADGLTNLACIRLTSVSESGSSPKGMAILLHQEGSDRSSLVEPARRLADSGFEVLLYDQRASGFTTEKYRGDGQLEAGDLESLIGYLEIHKQLIRPLVVVGYRLGADAAMLAENDEQRIDKVVAVNPHLTSERMLQTLCRERGVMWFPFSQRILWWWYKIRSGYGTTYRTVQDIQAVHCKTVLVVSADRRNGSEVTKLVELSPKELLTVKSVEETDVVREALSTGQ